MRLSNTLFCGSLCSFCAFDHRAMRARIDFSIFSSPTDSYGTVSGFMDIEACPGAGETFALKVNSDADCPPPGFFDMEFVVDAARYDPVSGICALNLSVVVVDGREQADQLMAYCERAYGLMADKFGED